MKATIVEFCNPDIEMPEGSKLRGLLIQEGAYRLLLAQTEPGDLALRFYESLISPDEFVPLDDPPDLLFITELVELGIPDLSSEQVYFISRESDRRARIARLKENVASLLLRA